MGLSTGNPGWTPIYAKATATSGQSLVSGLNTVLFPTTVFESNSGSISSSQFVVPASGKYDVFARFVAGTTSGLSTCVCYIKLNTTVVSEKPVIMSFTATNYAFEIWDTISATAGDSILIQFQNGFGTSVSVATTANYNIFLIERAG